MKHFKFEDFSGFPLDQQVLKDMQSSYHEGILAFCQSLKASAPFVLNGCNYTLGDISPVDVTPGIIYNPSTNKLYYFAGGLIYIGQVFVYNAVPESLDYEGGTAVGAESYTATLTVSSGESAMSVINRRWYNLLDALMYAPPVWVKWDDRPGIAELWYCHNKKTNQVTIKGTMVHNNTSAGSTTLTEVKSLPLPNSIIPDGEDNEVISTTSLRGEDFLISWGYRLSYGVGSDSYYDRGTVILTPTPDGTFLHLICEKLPPAYTTSLKHYIYFTYQLT